jgi:hypothetical protein
MKNLIPVAAVDTATVSIPEDGIDPRNMTTLEPALQKLVNNDLAFKNAAFRKIYCSHARLGVNWNDYNSGTGSMLAQYLVAQGIADAVPDNCIFTVDLPVGSKITGYGMRILPTAGHVGLPVIKPSILVEQLDQDLGSFVGVGSPATNDGSANVAAYELAHTVEKTGLSHVVIADRQYFVRVGGEGGVNRINDLYVTAVWVVVAAP